MKDLDKTLPISGGWIYIKQVIPVETYVPALSYWYAMPHKIQVRGANTLTFAKEHFEGAEYYTHHRFAQDKYTAALTLLWRKRCGGKLDDLEQGNLDRMLEQTKAPDSYDPAFDEDDDFSVLDAANFGLEMARQETRFDPLKHLLEDVPLEMDVKILTPNGSVILQPQEYEIVPDIKAKLAEVDGEHFMMKHFGSETQIKKLDDQIHYLRSRGIPKADAITLVMGRIKSQKVFWLEYHRAYAQMYGLNQPCEPIYEIEAPPDRVRVVHAGAVSAEKPRNVEVNHEQI